jgi:hypothetical protein
MDLPSHSQERESLALAAKVFALFPEPIWSGATISGQVTCCQENITILQEAEAASMLYPSEDYKLPKKGKLSEIELHVPQDPFGAYFARNLDSLLECVPCQYRAPTNCYFADDNQFLGDPGADKIPEISKYSSTLKLIDLIRRTADHEVESPTGLRLIFLLGEKLEINIIYEVSQLVQLEKLPSFESMLFDDIHTEQKLQIWKRILTDELRQQPMASRFSYFISRFDEFTERFYQNYGLYVSGFSYASVLEELNEKKLEYVARLSKVFSEIQNQLLAIPVALILAGSQLEYKKFISLKNTLVWSGSLIFLILLSMLIFNQLDNIGAVHSEIKSQQKILEAKHKLLSGDFDKIYKRLLARITRQKAMLWFMFSIVLICFVFTTAIYLWYSDYPKGRWEFLNNMATTIKGNAK